MAVDGVTSERLSVDFPDLPGIYREILCCRAESSKFRPHFSHITMGWGELPYSVKQGAQLADQGIEASCEQRLRHTTDGNNLTFRRKEDSDMTSEQRRFKNERQPLLPLNEADRQINKRDQLRETQHPQQLDLIPTPQRDMFPVLDLP